MKHETPTLSVKQRERTGTRYAQRLRKSGQLPAVIYGHGKPAVHVSVDEKEVLRHLHHGAHVMELSIDGNGTVETCLVKDLQFGYLGDNLIHVDFARVNLDEEVTVLVSLNFVGEAHGAQQAGAVQNTILNELEVRCKVSAIPEEIRVDISHVENSLSVGEIELPPGVVTDVSPDEPVLVITIKQVEEAVGEEAEVAEAGEGEPEVITEAKAEERAADEGGDE